MLDVLGIKALKEVNMDGRSSEGGADGHVHGWLSWKDTLCMLFMCQREAVG